MVRKMPSGFKVTSFTPTASKYSTYRGYSIEERADAHASTPIISVWVSKDGENYRFSNLDAAYDWIDAKRRKQVQS